MSRKGGRLNAGESSPAANLKNISNHHHSAGLGNYINKQYNNPAFNRIKIGFNHNSKANSYDTGILSKPPKAPEKPVTPQMKYHHKIVDKVRASRPDLRNFEISKVIGLMWQDLAEEERKVFEDEYEDEKSAYQEVLRLYHGSGSYQSFLRKGRTEANELYEKQSKRDSAANVFVETDDSDLTDASLKQMSASRFHLNQRLMGEILTDYTTVATGESIVTNNKLASKRRQVEILKRHCNGLNKEVKALEEKHAECKRKWYQQERDFMKKLKGPLITARREHYHELKVSSLLYGLVPNADVSDGDMMELAPKKSKLLMLDQSAAGSSPKITVQNDVGNTNSKHDVKIEKNSSAAEKQNKN